MARVFSAICSAWLVSLTTATLFARFCGVELSLAEQVAHAGGVLGEYAKDALLDRKHDTIKQGVFVSAVLATLGLGLLVDNRFLWNASVMLLFTMFYAIRVPGTHGLCVKTAFLCSKTVFVGALHALWVPCTAGLDPATNRTHAFGVWIIFQSQSLLSGVFDLDDEASDRAKSVRTVATALGASRASSVIALVSGSLACVHLGQSTVASLHAAALMALIGLTAESHRHGVILGRIKFLRMAAAMTLCLHGVRNLVAHLG